MLPVPERENRGNERLSLDTLYNRFPDQAACIAHLEHVRWGNKPLCPRCGASGASPLPRERRHHCNKCNVSFSATTGTLFHHTHSDLQKWFLAIDILLRARRRPSVRRLSRTIQLNKNTVWHMMGRIDKAIASEKGFLERLVELGGKK